MTKDNLQATETANEPLSEAGYRDLFNSIDEGFCIIEVLFDETGRSFDYRFLDVNAAFETQTGLRNAVGRTIKELVSGHEAHWFEIYGEIVRTGEPKRFEDRAAALGRWYEVYAFPFGAPAKRQVAILFKDVLARKHIEAALRDSEARFRALVTAGSDAVYRMSADWRQMYQLDGRGFLVDTSSPNEGWVDTYIVPEDRSVVLAAIDSATRGKEMFELEHRVRRADGTIGWTLSRAVPILNDDGEIAEWFGAASDVTDRKAADVVLRESEERQTFLLKLSDALRPLADPGEIMAAASEALGQHLDVGRCGYGEVDETGEFFIVEHDWTDGAMASFRGKHRLLGFGPKFTEAYRAGRSVMIEDAFVDARAAGVEAAFEAAGGVRAGIGLPLIKDGRFVAALFVQQVLPRKWTATDEIPTRDVAERTWAAVERARAEAAMRESEALRHVALDSGRMGTWRWDLQNRTVWGDPLFLELWGFPPSDEPHALSLFSDRMSPDSAADTEVIVTKAIEAEEEFDGQIEIVAGPTAGHWIRWRGRARADTPSLLYGVTFDITEQRKAEQVLRQNEERQQVLVAELQHRTRNLMGVVRSMSDATMRSSTDLDDFEGKFRDRLAALARVQGLLSRLAETDRITFDELLRTELTAHGALGHEERRVTLKGPARVALRSSTVQTLAMALHELATNAIKHGALGTPSGRLAVEWRLAPAGDDNGPWLHIDWRESGISAPPIGEERPLGSGQGRELIEKALPYQLKAKTTFVLGPNGLHCTIVMPVSDRTPA